MDVRRYVRQKDAGKSAYFEVRAVRQLTLLFQLVQRISE